MRNNRGQSLVLFVLTLPILFLIFLGIYTIGRMSLLKQELDSIANMAISYGVDNIDEDNIVSKVENIIRKNKNDIDKVEVSFEDSKLRVMLVEDLNMKLSLLSGKLKVKSSYIGYLQEDKKIIERDK